MSLPKIDECRSEVLIFARLMEYKLRLNDYKGGWKECAPERLFSALNDEVLELCHELFGVPCGCREAICPHMHWTDSQKVALESADVANMAMMLTDVSGGLEEF